jgi:hypothetical protein
VITTAPLAGCVTDWIEIAPPSTSVSFASTGMALAPESSFTSAESLTATGGSSTQVTVTATVADEPPGVSVYVKVSGVPDTLLQ